MHTRVPLRMLAIACRSSVALAHPYADPRRSLAVHLLCEICVYAAYAFPSAAADSAYSDVWRPLGVPVSLVRAHRPITLFWQEKLAMLVFFLQCHALIWLQCYTFYPQEYVRAGSS
jgi:hypothetical protein